MSGTSRSRVTVTFGHSDQVVKKAGLVPGDSPADSVALAGRKRSVRDRLGYNSDDYLVHGYQLNNKRLRGDLSTSKVMDIGKEDLRYKLLQKDLSRKAQSKAEKFVDLREKLSNTVQRPILHPWQNATGSRDTRIRGNISPRRAVDDLHRTESFGSSYFTRTSSDRPRQISPDRILTSNHLRQRSADGVPSSSDYPRQRSPDRVFGSSNYPRQISPARMACTSRQRSPMRVPGIPNQLRQRSPDRIFGMPTHFRKRSPDRILGASRGRSQQGSREELEGIPLSRTIDNVRAASYMSHDVRDASRAASSASVMTRSPFPLGSVPPVAPSLGQLPSGTPVQRSSYPGDEFQTVDGFLRSLGLGKYALFFQAEEIDMTALKQMGENDLKDIGVPMGPRKKILLALAPPSKRQPLQ